MTQTPGIPFRPRSEANHEYQQNPSAGTSETTLLSMRSRIDQTTLRSSSDQLEARNPDHGDKEGSDATQQEQGNSATSPYDVLDSNHDVPQPTNPGSDTNHTMPVTTKLDLEPLTDLELRVSNEFIPIKEDNWDTVLYIGPPTQQHGQSHDEYEYIRKRFSRPYLMRSQTLRESGSAEFVRRLGPMSARVARKLKNLGLHHDLPGDGTPKYWIDLRPMQNDEEALLTVAELTCTPGVLGWHKHEAASQVDPSVINGKDALNTPRTSTDKLRLPPGFFSKSATALKSDPRGSGGQEEQQAGNGLEADYCQLRHHTALERLLRAISGHSPKLNSAPKMWTFFAVAKLFDCATHPRVISEIYTWIFSGSNSNFIEANPEVCYRIALGTQCDHCDQSKVLLRVVFSILVGEKALEQAMGRSSAQSLSSPLSAFIRPLSHLDDDEVNRIDHAARSLNLRVHKKFQDITEAPITWMTKSAELFKLFALVGVDDRTQDILNSAVKFLLAQILVGIQNTLSQDLKLHRRDALDTMTQNKEREFSPGAVKRYNLLTEPQRLLSQISWSFVKDNSVSRDIFAHRSFGLKPLHEFGLLAQSGTSVLFTRLQEYVDVINNYITDGYIHYNGVQSHRDHLGDYELRWDALYAAASRNVDNISHHMSTTEKTHVASIARERQRTHTRAINAYEVGHMVADQHARNGTDAGRGLFSSTGQFYTSARIETLTLLDQLSDGLRTMIEFDILQQGYLKNASGIEADISVKSIDTLLCLDEDEFRFLPLWADGCDDGTGGVFTESVPIALDEDFQGGRRGLGADEEGIDGLDDVEMGESFSMIDTEEAQSTVAGASKVATAGCGTDSVMSMDE